MESIIPNRKVVTFAQCTTTRKVFISSVAFRIVMLKILSVEMTTCPRVHIY
jgi:hypothetical protein